MGSIAKVIEISADSEKSFEDALKRGITEARDSLRSIQSVWIKDQVVLVSDGAPDVYRLHLKVTFKVEK